MIALDFILQSYISNGRTEFLTKFLYILTTLFDPYNFIFLAIGFSVLIYLFRGKKYALFFIGTLVVGVIVSVGLKELFGVARPVGGLVDVFGKSFPSGHTLLATMFFTLLMYIFDGYLTMFGRILLNALAVLLIFLVAFSRVYLGAHWATDVLSGIVIGALVTYMCVRTSQTWLVKKA